MGPYYRNAAPVERHAAPVERNEGGLNSVPGQFEVPNVPKLPKCSPCRAKCSPCGAKRRRPEQRTRPTLPKCSPCRAKWSSSSSSRVPCPSSPKPPKASKISLANYIYRKEGGLNSDKRKTGNTADKLLRCQSLTQPLPIGSVGTVPSWGSARAFFPDSEVRSREALKPISFYQYIL